MIVYIYINMINLEESKELRKKYTQQLKQT